VKKEIKKIETSTTRILFKESRKNPFFEDEYSALKKNLEDELSNEDEESIVEIYSITIVSFNILFRQKNVEIFVVFIKNLQNQLKKQNSSTVSNSKTVISSEYHDFLNVFFKKKADILSLHKNHDYRIKLEKDHKSDHKYASFYNLSTNEFLLIKKYLKEHLNNNFIESSIACYASLILFAKKLNDELRFFVDYRKLNTMIKKNQYSISLIVETIVRLSKTK
jgi:hypothetical protein